MAASTTPATLEGTHIFGYLLEKAQTLDERYSLLEGASTTASTVLEKYPSIATKAGETYEMAKTLVPDDYKTSVEKAEKELCALDKAALTSHAQTLDSRIQEGTAALMKAAEDKRRELVDNVVSAASERAIHGISFVDSGIDLVESTVDYVLPEEQQQDASAKSDTRVRSLTPTEDKPEKPQSNNAPPSEHVQYVAQKAYRTSKKAQRRLQKKAFEGLKDLRLRSQTIGAVDLIQYNRFLDLDTLMEGAAAVSKDVQQVVEGTRGLGEALVTDTFGKAIKAYEVIEGELVVAAKPVWDNLEGKAENGIAKINTVVVEPAKEFYTTVVLEFLNNPTNSAKEFKAKVEDAVGAEWTKALEEPTMALWESMKLMYASAPGDVDTLVANVGARLYEAWGQNVEVEVENKPISRSNSMADLATQDAGFPFRRISPDEKSKNATNLQ